MRSWHTCPILVFFFLSTSAVGTVVSASPHRANCILNKPQLLKTNCLWCAFKRIVEVGFRGKYLINILLLVDGFLNDLNVNNSFNFDQTEIMVSLTGAKI